MKQILHYISIVLLLIPFILFFNRGNNIPMSFELPISDSNGFLVDKYENIYIDCGHYKRVQVYNNKGQYINSWKIPNINGIYNLEIQNSLFININTYSKNKQYKYDLNGNLLKISNKKYHKKEKEVVLINDKTFIRSGIFKNEIKITKPINKILVKQSLFLQILNFPFGMGVIFFIGVFIKEFVIKKM